MPLNEAWPELADLLTATRTDWHPDITGAALDGVRRAGIPWPRVLSVTLTAALDEGCTPYSIRDALAPVRRDESPPADPGLIRALVEQAAESCEAASAELRAAADRRDREGGTQ